jgi:hypothetical protein
MALVRTDLRLPRPLLQELDSLLGDRPRNVCLIRAVELWVARERVIRGIDYVDGGQPRQPFESRRDGNGNGDGDDSMMRKASPPTPLVQVPDETVPPPTREELDEPRQRRPPRSVESWGSE